MDEKNRMRDAWAMQHGRITTPGPAAPQPGLQLFYLSFAGPDGWIGAVIVPGDSLPEALTLASILELNPGGQVRGLRFDLDRPQPPPGYCGRMLDREDVKNLDAALARRIN